jgi:hypothetical protein
MKTIWSNPAGKAWLREYSIKVESFGQTFANCLILPPKREDIPATIYTRDIAITSFTKNKILNLMYY